nr:retrovirus-related Pol polyprotein from transposon TNT 1-94 [Tanacetum cinerariifolium]
MKENLFIPASMSYDQEMVPKSKDWVKRLNPDSKLPNFNTGRILVLLSQAINESLKPTKGSNEPESVEISEENYLTPLPSLKIFKELLLALRGTIFNSKKEVVMIAPIVRDVYVLDMTSSAQESCFFTKASDNLNWL